tara:strand:+ start:1729 stop:2106 length:378 start_codon:yes stop_codon:yes gene_type:complete
MKTKLKTSNPLRTYFNLINFQFKLSEQEMDVLEFFVKRYFDFKNIKKDDVSVLAETVIFNMIFLKGEKKNCRELLSINVKPFHNIIMHLKNKGILGIEDGVTKIHPVFLLNPNTTEITFVLDVSK